MRRSRNGGIVYEDNYGFTVTWNHWSPQTTDMDIRNWIVAFTKPNGEKVVVDQHTTWRSRWD